MLNSSSAGSFAGELDKWHKYFQTIEQVLEVWLEVQDLWFELEEVGGALYCCKTFHCTTSTLFYPLVDCSVRVF